MADNGHMPYPPVTIMGTELRELHSANTGRDYEIFVSTPRNYRESGRKYPVLYLLDGQWDFKTLDSILGGLVCDKFAAEMFIVGISYGGENPDFEKLRAIDYTPVCPEGADGFGEAPRFLKFLADELIPFVEREYPADPADRGIAGSSYGGLFTFYALFQAPELFPHHISVSPAVAFADCSIFGSEAFTRGLREVFRRPVVALSDELADALVGTYRFDPFQTQLFIRRDGDQLFASIGLYPDYSDLVLPLSETELSFEVEPMLARINRASDGRVESLAMSTTQGDIVCPRL